MFVELGTNRAKYIEDYLLFYDAILNSVINRSELSSQLIEKFRKHFTTTNDTVNYYLTQTEYRNYTKLSDYKNLKEIGKITIEKLRRFNN